MNINVHLGSILIFFITMLDEANICSVISGSSYYYKLDPKKFTLKTISKEPLTFYLGDSGIVPLLFDAGKSSNSDGLFKIIVKCSPEVLVTCDFHGIYQRTDFNQSIKTNINITVDFISSNNRYIQTKQWRMLAFFIKKPATETFLNEMESLNMDITKSTTLFKSKFSSKEIGNGTLISIVVLSVILLVGVVGWILLFKLKNCCFPASDNTDEDNFGEEIFGKSSNFLTQNEHDSQYIQKNPLSNNSITEENIYHSLLFPTIPFSQKDILSIKIGNGGLTPNLNSDSRPEVVQNQRSQNQSHLPDIITPYLFEREINFKSNSVFTPLSYIRNLTKTGEMSNKLFLSKDTIPINSKKGKEASKHCDITPDIVCKTNRGFISKVMDIFKGDSDTLSKPKNMRRTENYYNFKVKSKELLKETENIKTTIPQLQNSVACQKNAEFKIKMRDASQNYTYKYPNSVLSYNPQFTELDNINIIHVTPAKISANIDSHKPTRRYKMKVVDFGEDLPKKVFAESNQPNLKKSVNQEKQMETGRVKKCFEHILVVNDEDPFEVDNNQTKYKHVSQLKKELNFIAKKVQMIEEKVYCDSGDLGIKKNFKDDILISVGTQSDNQNNEADIKQDVISDPEVINVKTFSDSKQSAFLSIGALQPSKTSNNALSNNSYFDLKHYYKPLLNNKKIDTDEVMTCPSKKFDYPQEQPCIGRNNQNVLTYNSCRNIQLIRSTPSQILYEGKF